MKIDHIYPTVWGLGNFEIYWYSLTEFIFRELFED